MSSLNRARELEDGLPGNKNKMNTFTQEIDLESGLCALNTYEDHIPDLSVEDLVTPAQYPAHNAERLAIPCPNNNENSTTNKSPQLLKGPSHLPAPRFAVSIRTPGTQHNSNESCLARRALHALASGERLTSEAIEGVLSSWLSSPSVRIESAQRLDFNESRRELPRSISNITIPINHAEIHWALAVVDLRQQTISHFVSVKNTGVGSDTVRRRIAKLNLRSPLYSGSNAWAVENVPSSTQQNGVDCGVYVITNAIFSMLRISQPPFPVHAELWRMVLAWFIEQNLLTNDSIGADENPALFLCVRRLLTDAKNLTEPKLLEESLPVVLQHLEGIISQFDRAFDDSEMAWRAAHKDVVTLLQEQSESIETAGRLQPFLEKAHETTQTRLSEAKALEARKQSMFAVRGKVSGLQKDIERAKREVLHRLITLITSNLGALDKSDRTSGRNMTDADRFSSQSWLLLRTLRSNANATFTDHKALYYLIVPRNVG